MTFSMILRTLFEILLFAAVVWGFYNENKLVSFEKRLFCAIRRKKLKIVRAATCRNAAQTGR